MLNIYTDGSSKANGKPECTAGWAFYTNINGKEIIRYGHIPAPSSNNQGEILGVLFGSIVFKDYLNKVNFISDSQYVVKSLNEWRHKHAKTNYDGIKNIHLLLPLYKNWDSNGKMSIEWTKGHAGNIGNEKADEWCGLGCKQIVRNVSNDFSNIKYIEYNQIQELIKQCS